MIRTFSRAVLVVCLLGGCSPRDQRTCTRNEDCGASATCMEGVCLGQVPAVAITAPSGPAFTNGILPVEVSIANCVPDKVELLVSGLPVTTLNSQRAYDWNTTRSEEGTYELAVRAIVAGQVVTSEPRMVVVDRTAPAVIARSPRDGDGNVPFSAPFQVTFSEPMLPASVTDTTVLVTDSNGTALPKRLVLSADGKTLNIMLSGVPPLPVAVRVSLLGLSDLAGNSVASTDAWGFTVQMGSDYVSPNVVARIPETGDTNVPIGMPFQITFSEPIRPESVNDSAILVTGTGGVSLSKRLALAPDDRTISITLVGTPALPASVSIDLAGVTDLAGNPVVAQASPWSFTIPEWWHPWPLPVSDGQTDASSAAVAVDASGSPIVTYVAPMAGARRLFVSRWNGVAWQDLASALNVIGDVYGPAVQVGPDGTPVLAWLEFIAASSQQYVLVARCIGGEWKAIAGSRLDSSQALNVNKAANAPGGVHGSPAGMKITIALDAAGNPTIGWPEIVGTGSSARWNYFVAQWNGTGWNRLGSGTAPGTNTWNAALVLKDSRPLVVAEEDDSATRSAHVRAFEWDGAWLSRYGTNVDEGTNAVMNPTVAVDSAGMPIIAYTEFVGIHSNLVTRRWNSIIGSWESVASGSIADATYPALAANARGDVMLAYSQTGVVAARWSPVTRSFSNMGVLTATVNNAGPQLTFSSTGVPVVAWVEQAGTTATHTVLLKTLNQ